MNNKRLLAVLASACVALLTQSTVFAKGFNYTYVEGGYRNIDGDSIEGEGFEAGFSFAATDYVHLLGRYSHLALDDADGFSSVSLDVDEFKIGFGGNYTVMDKVDLVLDAVYVDDELTGKARVDGNGFVPGTGPKSRVNSNSEGYEATFYARVRAMKKLEMTPHVVYRDVGSESDTGFGLGLVYKVYKKISVRVRATRFTDDSATNLFLGLRADL